MEIEHSKLFECNMDVAIIEAITKYPEVAKLFNVQTTDVIEKVFHSYTSKEKDGNTGESDILFIFKDKNGQNNALFIEDKINAIAMDRQAERYYERAEILSEQFKFGKNFLIFLCAPQKYIDTGKSDGYVNIVSYEQILEFIDDELLKSQFEYSISEKSVGYVPTECKPITQFWGQLYQYLKNNYQNKILYNVNKGSRGKNANWPIFTTQVVDTSIVWKSDRNFLDLEFSCKLNKRDQITNDLKKIGIQNPNLVKTGKSLSLHEIIPDELYVSFRHDFNSQIAGIEYVLKKTLIFYEVVEKLHQLNTLEYPRKAFKKGKK